MKNQGKIVQTFKTKRTLMRKIRVKKLNISNETFPDKCWKIKLDQTYYP